MKSQIKIWFSTLLSITIIGASFIVQAENAFADSDKSVPISGVAAEGNVGHGLYDSAFEVSRRLETGIAVMDLTINYYPNLDQIIYTYYTSATDRSNEVGMEPISLEIWDEYMNDWVQVDSKTLLDYNTKGSSRTLIYSHPQRGRRYRVTGYHHAVINGITFNRYNETGYITIP